MILKTKLTENEIKDLAISLGLKANVSPKGKGKSYRITLKHSSNVSKKETFVRRGFSNKKINAVCLHGYTAFMLAVFEKDNTARFKSSLYPSLISQSNILDAYHKIENRNIGSIYNPMFYGDACYCDDNTITQVYEQSEKAKSL